MYKPDNWVVLKIKQSEMGPEHSRILAGWGGGYLGGEEWRLNSGIVRCEEIDGAFLFHGSSGSLYTCLKNSYGLRTNTARILDLLQKKIGEENLIMLPEDTDWLEVDWTSNKL